MQACFCFLFLLLGRLNIRINHWTTEARLTMEYKLASHGNLQKIDTFFSRCPLLGILFLIAFLWNEICYLIAGRLFPTQEEFHPLVMVRNE